MAIYSNKKDAILMQLIENCHDETESCSINLEWHDWKGANTKDMKVYVAPWWRKSLEILTGARILF